jgi:hypothetical protein
MTCSSDEEQERVMPVKNLVQQGRRMKIIPALL